MKTLEAGRRYHCREMHTGKHRTGFFWYDAETMEVRLFDYEEFFHIGDGVPLTLRLEENSVVSMHDTLVSGPGRSMYMGSSPSTIYYTGVVANTVVVGRRAWSTSDPIRRVWFRVPRLKQLLANSERLDAATRPDAATAMTATPLFQVVAGGLTARCWYFLQGSLRFGATDWEPILEVEYEAPRALGSYLEGVHSLLQFFSASAGFQLAPTDIFISPSLRRAPGEGRGEDDNFSVQYLWPHGEVDEPDLHIRNSFAMTWTAADVRNLEACLEAWLLREAQWQTAASLMMGSLGLVKQTSGQRLLMACRWLEAIPGALATPALSRPEVSTITSAAAAAARGLGRQDLEARIAGALAPIRKESSLQRFTRLVRLVQDIFGANAFGTDETGAGIVATLMDAMTLRGREAHGHVVEDGTGFMPLFAATTSMEALCYLLTIRDLPMCAEAKSRALSSRLVRTQGYARLHPDLQV